MNDKVIQSWKDQNIYKVREKREVQSVKDPKVNNDLRKEIEPWLTALFQSEHLSLFVGSGISLATHSLAIPKNENDARISKIDFSVFKEQIDKASQDSAKKAHRGEPNIEDQIRVANELIKGLEIYISTDVYNSGEMKKELQKLEEELQNGLGLFCSSVLASERKITHVVKDSSIKNLEKSSEYLMSFLVSFASRSSTRERLNIFTTNYDRIIEYGAELAGIRLIDRFVGTINPVFRSSRVEVDMHYNPPGIRGEPRYLEGVVHFTKLHGSLDWVMRNRIVRRVPLPYGAKNLKNYTDTEDILMIYPNAAKDRETSEYPYVELFRDFSSAVCLPNSTLVLYGYSFGDQHINRIIEDMLTIPSTHLVIISYSDEGDRIKRFYENLKRPAQVSLMIGNHFGDLKILVDRYLPKPAIDRTTFKMAELLKARGLATPQIETDGDIKS